MNDKTEAAYDKAREAISEAGVELGRGDYKIFLDELAAHLQCLIDCWIEEEKPEQP